MALSRLYLRNVHRLTYSAVSCKLNDVPLTPAKCNTNLANSGMGISSRLMLLTDSRVYRQKCSGHHTAGCACDD